MNLEEYIRKNYPNVTQNWESLLSIIENIRVQQGFPEWPQEVKTRILSELKDIPFQDMKRSDEAHEIIAREIEELEWQYKMATSSKKLH